MNLSLAIFHFCKPYPFRSYRLSILRASRRGHWYRDGDGTMACFAPLVWHTRSMDSCNLGRMDLWNPCGLWGNLLEWLLTRCKNKRSHHDDAVRRRHQQYHWMVDSMPAFVSNKLVGGCEYLRMGNGCCYRLSVHSPRRFFRHLFQRYSRLGRCRTDRNRADSTGRIHIEQWLGVTSSP